MTPRALPRVSLAHSASIFIVTLLASLCAFLATPVFTKVQDAPSLEKVIPQQFGDWKAIQNPYAQVRLTTDQNAEATGPYDQVLMRTYINSRGEKVMLALAWVRSQRQEVKVHRPDLCYVAQGFKIRSLAPSVFRTVRGPVPGKLMVATSNQGGEAVAYWIRVGSIYSESALETRAHIFKEGLSGRISDGILVRASQSIHNEAEAGKAFPLLEIFLAELTLASPDEAKTLMIRQQK